MLQDSQLQKAVIAELGWEPSVDSAHIGVSAHDGVVTLNGHVQNFSQKLAAEKAVGRVKGVKAVAEEIEVKLPFDIERGDEDIASAAIEGLAWDSLGSPRRRQGACRKGMGHPQRQSRLALSEGGAALGVGTLHGVIGVSNQILIEPAVDTRDVAADITRALHRSWYYDSNTIRVSAQGGKIKLTGNVTTWNARDLAGTAAWAAPGGLRRERHTRPVLIGESRTAPKIGVGSGASRRSRARRAPKEQRNVDLFACDPRGDSWRHGEQPAVRHDRRNAARRRLHVGQRSRLSLDCRWRRQLDPARRPGQASTSAA